MTLNDAERRLYLHQCGGSVRRHRHLTVPSVAARTTPGAGSSSRSIAALRVTRKYRQAAVRQREYRKLKAIVPAVSAKQAVSKLTIIEEAIKYIDKLHTALVARLENTFSADVLPLGNSNGCHANPDAFIRQLCFDSFHARNPPAPCQRDEPDIVTVATGTGNYAGSSDEAEQQRLLHSGVAASHRHAPAPVSVRLPLSDRQLGDESRDRVVNE